MKDELEFDSPDPSICTEMNQEIASCWDFATKEVPARDDTTKDNWDALVKDAFTDDSVNNGVHKRMRRKTLTYWSRYVHMSLYPKPDPRVVVYEAEIAVVFMLHRAMQFCLEKNLLSDEDGRVDVQHVIDRCELYFGQNPHS